MADASRPALGVAKIIYYNAGLNLLAAKVQWTGSSASVFLIATPAITNTLFRQQGPRARTRESRRFVGALPQSRQLGSLALGPRKSSLIAFG
jgi:hypothetical protein